MLQFYVAGKTCIYRKKSTLFLYVRTPLVIASHNLFPRGQKDVLTVEFPRVSQATYTWTCTADGQTHSQSRIAKANANSKQQQITLIIYLAHLYHRQGILSIELDKSFIIL
jgi:hypothetical protein